MKTSTFALICLAFFSTTALLSAQELTKKEKKALRNELNELAKNPERLKAMKEEGIALDQQMQEKESWITDRSFIADKLAKDLEIKDQEIDVLRKNLSDLSSQLTLSNNTTQADTSSLNVSEPVLKEVYFSVQIGAYKNLKIIETIRNSTNFTVEEDDGSGYKKFLIGKFDTYKEAKNLTKVLTSSGAQCFVVAYKNNSRLSTLKELPKEYF